MTKAELAKANEINEQIKVLTEFLESNKKCWGVLKFFATPAKQLNTQITLKTSYGCYSEEITASKRLSAVIIEAVKHEVSLLESELENIGRGGEP